MPLKETKKTPPRRLTYAVKIGNISQKPHILVDFNYVELPKNYREGIGECLERLPIEVIPEEEKQKLIELFKIPTRKQLQNKEAVLFLPIDYLITIRGNIYRDGDEEYYLDKYTRKDKVEVPLLDIYTQWAVDNEKKENEIIEGNHRVLALKKMGFSFAPVRAFYKY